VSTGVRTRVLGIPVPSLNRRQRRELVVVVLGIAVALAAFFSFGSLAHGPQSDADIREAMQRNIAGWNTAPWYAQVDGTPGPANITVADGVLSVQTRFAPDTSAAIAFDFCTKVASITHDSGTGVRLAIDRVMIYSGQVFLARCFTPTF
jgi:hypothetical protein